MNRYKARQQMLSEIFLAQAAPSIPISKWEIEIMQIMI